MGDPVFSEYHSVALCLNVTSIVYPSTLCSLDENRKISRELVSTFVLLSLKNIIHQSVAHADVVWTGICLTRQPAILRPTHILTMAGCSIMLRRETSFFTCSTCTNRHEWMGQHRCHTFRKMQRGPLQYALPQRSRSKCTGSKAPRITPSASANVPASSVKWQPSWIS